MLYAICGKKRVGKDCAANFIKDKTNAIPYQLAHPIKMMLCHGFKDARVTYNDFIINMSDINGETSFDRESPIDFGYSNPKTVLVSALGWLRTHHGTMFTNFMYCKARAMVDELTKTKNSWSMRELMQTLGTDICVSLDKMIWIKLFAIQYMTAIGNNQSMVVVDCRQSHEINALRLLGANVIHIQRPSVEQVATDSHITEQGLSIEEGDHVIVNDGAINKLNYLINCLLYSITGVK